MTPEARQESASPEPLRPSQASPPAEGAAPVDTSQTAAEPQMAVATRSGQYALIAALLAAIISSLVSAGASVYVSVNQANRGDRLAAIESIRANRQNVYNNFVVAMLDYLSEIGGLTGPLQYSPLPFDIKDITRTISDKNIKLQGCISLMTMTGGDETAVMVSKFSTTLTSFTRDHYLPFALKYADKDLSNAISGDEWKQDRTNLATSLNAYLGDMGILYGEFMELARKDLRTDI